MFLIARVPALPRLTHHLLALLRTHSDNTDAVRLITSCLGEIGTYEVSQGDTNQQRSPPTILENLWPTATAEVKDYISRHRTSQDNIAGIIYRERSILQHLEKCLKHPKWEIMTAAVTCLANALGDNTFNLDVVVTKQFPYLHPFLTVTPDADAKGKDTWSEQVRQSRVTWNTLQGVWYVLPPTTCAACSDATYAISLIVLLLPHSHTLHSPDLCKQTLTFQIDMIWLKCLALSWF